MGYFNYLLYMGGGANFPPLRKKINISRNKLAMCMKFYTKLHFNILHNIIQENIHTITYFADVSIFKMKSDVNFGENREKFTKNRKNDVRL